MVATGNTASLGRSPQPSLRTLSIGWMRRCSASVLPMFQFRSAKHWSRSCFPTPSNWRATLPRWCAVFDKDLGRTPSMTTTALDRRTSLSIFERMLMIRHFEEAVIQLYKQGRFVSHYHIYIGQEATGGAVLKTLGEKDLICTTHRNHGHIIGRGC